jgi:hypothetical protein
MKTLLFLVCCTALGVGSGCATDSGGTADERGVVSGSGFYSADPEHREYYWNAGSQPPRIQLRGSTSGLFWGAHSRPGLEATVSERSGLG